MTPSTAASSLLIVDDEPNIRSSLSRSLEMEGYRCVAAEDVASAHAMLDVETIDLVLLDVKLPDGNGLDVLRWISAKRPGLPVVMMSGHGTVEMALDAVRSGAHDFVEKPLSVEKLLVTIGNALRFAGQGSELARLRAQLDGASELLGSSGVMGQLRERIALAAPSQGRVLITGESGTGKELIARAVHRGSTRAKGPFVKVNCAAIPVELIESELFGHEKGAFTGAHQARKGRFELAHTGTLFLDEIGDMRLDVQAKVLRALQEGEVERVGGGRTIRVDVRVVAATNKDLEAAIQDGSFREDLYYRLQVVPIAAPPLRQRKGDIAELAGEFLGRACADNGLPAKTMTPDALAALVQHDWPGNVRELRNACERLAILTPGAVIDALEVRRLLGDPRTVGTGGSYRAGVELRVLMSEAERDLILAALDDHRWHVTRTAGALGLERSHLYKKMRALGIRRQGEPADPADDEGP